MNSKLLIAADIVPTKSNLALFANGDALSLLGKELHEKLSNADFISMNLEVPLVDKESPILKCGPNLIAPTSSIAGLKAINPFFFTLANNHIMDQGEEGLISTIATLKCSGIDYAGVGRTLTEARKPYIRDINGLKIGIYCCAEHEFSISTESKPGANPFDSLESFDDVKLLKEQCEYVIVLYHGGKEHYRYPSPNLQRVFRKFADSGADLVVAQHTHCIGCKEEYKNSMLVYGQGNFLFDYSDSVYWQSSMIIEVELNKKDNPITFIPIVKKGNVVRIADEEAKKTILDEFHKRSFSIMRKGFIQDEYFALAKSMEEQYLLRIHGAKSRSLFMRALNKLTRYEYIKALYPSEYRLIVENVIECEAHSELALEIMKLYRHQR